MSAICGILNLDDRPARSDALDAMLATQQRRGPDGCRIWLDGPVGLGHAMLWTTPESLRESPPVVHERGHLAVVADVRLDNRAELIRDLNLQHRPPAEIGDTELILHAYAKWGRDCPTHLLGAFAFAVWDARRRTLFCARDHFGIKPFLYFHRRGKQFVFGSEAKAVLAAPGVPCRVNEPRIADYLVTDLEGIDKTSTFYRDVFRFPPAHWLEVDEHGMRTGRYWALDPSRERRFASDEEAVAAFLDLFTEAVRCRLRVHGPPASMLSGGMDSSAIVAVARDLLAENGRGPLHTYSAVADDESDCIESESIRAVLAQSGVLPHTLSPNQLDAYFDDFDYVVRNTDDPFDNLITHVPLTMYSAARQDGVRVLLDGVGGDHVVSVGYGYLSCLLRAGKLGTFVQEMRGLDRFWSQAKDMSGWHLAYRHGLLPVVPESMRAIYRSLRRRNRGAQAIENSVIRTEFASTVDLHARLRALHGAEQPRTIRQLQIASFEHPYLVVALERYDRVAAAYGVEPRRPYLDKRLVEFCVALPWQQIVRKGWRKKILRQAMVGRLPDQTVYRRDKQHLGPAFTTAWYNLAAHIMESMLETATAVIAPYVDLEAVRKAYQRYLAHNTLQDGYHVWQAVSLALWRTNSQWYPAEPQPLLFPASEASLNRSIV